MTVVSLSAYKADQAFSSYQATSEGVFSQERAFFATGKFTPMAQTFLDFGQQAEHALALELTVCFRDYRPNPEARALKAALIRDGFDLHKASRADAKTKAHKTLNASPNGAWATKSLCLRDAHALFPVDTPHPIYGAHQPSLMGYRTNPRHQWDARGVGYHLCVLGYDARRPLNGAPRPEQHLVDNETDWRDLQNAFALVARAAFKTL